MSDPEDVAAHTTSLAVWDLASSVVAGRRATLKVGLACPSGCDLSGTRIDVYDESGTRVGGGTLGPEPWPGTTALHWVELEVAAPETEGDHAWSLHAAAPFDHAPGAVSDSRTAPGASHLHEVATVGFVVSRPPEHRVTLEVIEKGSGAPLAGVELRLGRCRTVTNEAGVALVEVPGGTYEVCAWKIGYDLLSRTARVSADTTIHLEVAVTPEPEQPYWV